MVLERICTRRRALVEGAVFALACFSNGCSLLEEEDTIPQPSVRFTEIELQTGIWRWRDSLPPEIREEIDKELLWGENLLVHVSLGHIPKEESRGGRSTLAATAAKKGWCKHHPEVEGIPPGRNWDLTYDPEAAAYWAARLKIPHPIEVSLHHELFGHILPALRDPGLMDRIGESRKANIANERKTLAIENEYRRHLGLPEVPDEVIFPKWFLAQEGMLDSSTP